MKILFLLVGSTGKIIMGKIDFKKTLKELYLPSAKEVVVVEVPAMNFAMVDGAGHPDDSEGFQEAVQALYGVTFTIKMSPPCNSERDTGCRPHGFSNWGVALQFSAFHNTSTLHSADSSCTR